MSGRTAPAAALAGAATFRHDVLRGLAASPKAVPGKYLWDARGSQLFEEITRSPAYYATTTEMRLLASAAGEIARGVGSNASVVELGSGATHKVGLLLDALDAPRRYVGIDISAEFTAAAAARLRAAHPSVEVLFVEADYSRDLPLLPLDRERPILGFLPGSTIGNMEPAEGGDLLTRIREAQRNGWLLIGHDPNQDSARLMAAYGSLEMAAFHENLLVRLRRDLDARLTPAHFHHEARVLDAPRRVEAHLVAREPTEIAIGDRIFPLGAGESIRTDVSWKYARADFTDLALSAGWTPIRQWPDADGLFCLYLLRAP